MEGLMDGRNVEEIATEAEVISHCYSCRPRRMMNVFDHDENLTIPLSHLGEIEIRRYAQLSMARRSNYLELTTIDLICKDELPDHLYHFMPSLGFNFTLQSSNRKVRKKWFCRASWAFSAKEYDQKQLVCQIMLNWNKFYSTNHFPMLKQVKCIKAVNRFLFEMLLTSYEVIEFSNFFDPVLLSIEENSLSNHHAKFPKMHSCSKTCNSDDFKKRDKKRVELNLLVPYGGLTAKINFQRVYCLTVNNCYWVDPSYMRTELVACDLIKNDNFSKQLLTTLEEMGFCFSIRLDKSYDSRDDMWLIRGMFAPHQEPLELEDVQSLELIEAMQITCFSSKYHELLQTEFTMRFYMPSLDVDAPMTRIAILSSDYFERKINGSLELVFLDLIRVENVLPHSVPYLPFLGFCCKLILHHDNSRRIEHVYARMLECKRDMLLELDNETINTILGSIKMYYATYFEVFKTVKCQSKFERVVSYGLPSCKHSFGAINSMDLEYPLETIPSYFESQHPMINASDCYTCTKPYGEAELKMCRRMIIRLPSISLDHDIKRYFNLYTLNDIGESEDDEQVELEVLDFIESDTICYKQMPLLTALGFCCELISIDAATLCEISWLVRGLNGKCSKADLNYYEDYADCLDGMDMYEGKGIGDLTTVNCPQTVINYIDRFGFGDMIVKRSSLSILEGGEKYIIPKHHH